MGCWKCQTLLKVASKLASSSFLKIIGLNDNYTIFNLNRERKYSVVLFWLYFLDITINR